MKIIENQAFDKKNIYKLYSDNLSFYSDLKGSYVCPICLRVFKEHQIDSLTCEHSIPKKLGGKKNILTCKTCNNKLGSKYISKLVKILEISDIDKGLSEKTLDAKVLVNGMELNTEFSQEHNGMKFVIPEDRNNPKNIEEINLLFSKGQVPEFQTKINMGPGKQFLRPSLLILSHLMIFSQFGYYYLLNSSGIFIRNLITSEDFKNPICNHLILSNNDLIKQIHKEGIFILLCYSPEYFNGHVTTILPLRTANDLYIFGTVLPVLPELKIDTSNYGKNIRMTIVKYPFDKKFLQTKMRFPGEKYIFR